MENNKLRIVQKNQSFKQRTEPRVCYRLEADNKISSENRSISKIGGLPYWPVSEAWPLCSGCGDPLSFIAQLRSDDAFKISPTFPRFLCFFYCFRCAPWWDVANEGFLLRWMSIRTDVELLPAKATPLPAPNSPPPVALTTTQCSDYPDLHFLMSERNYEAASAQIALAHQPNLSTSKLGGYPTWIQKPDIPLCRSCSAPMRFLGQLNTGKGEFLPGWETGRFYFFGCSQSCTTDALSIVMQAD